MKVLVAVLLFALFVLLAPLWLPMLLLRIAWGIAENMDADFNQWLHGPYSRWLDRWTP